VTVVRTVPDRIRSLRTRTSHATGPSASGDTQFDVAAAACCPSTQNGQCPVTTNRTNEGDIRLSDGFSSSCRHTRNINNAFMLIHLSGTSYYSVCHHIISPRPSSHLPTSSKSFLPLYHTQFVVPTIITVFLLLFVLQRQFIFTTCPTVLFYVVCLKSSVNGTRKQTNRRYK
jgi:hypothetical protein